jgi:hypothetical protein
VVSLLCLLFSLLLYDLLMSKTFLIKLSAPAKSKQQRGQQHGSITSNNGPINNNNSNACPMQRRIEVVVVEKRMYQHIHHNNNKPHAIISKSSDSVSQCSSTETNFSLKFSGLVEDGSGGSDTQSALESILAVDC